MADGDHERHRRARPSPSGLTSLGTALDVPGEVRVLRRLRGGLGAATHVIALTDGRRLVLKRYPPGDETAALEWERLSFAHAAGLPAPAPVAFDGDGAWFGSPAFVMSLIDGKADLTPKRLDRYLDQVAQALAHIHSTPVATATGALVRPHSTDTWEAPAPVPAGNLSTEMAHRIVAVLSAELPSVPRDRVLIHADFHPGNLVWRRGQLTGIVDWSGTRVGERWWELAYFRVELALLLDWNAATELLRRYEELVGWRSEHQPLWDLLHVFGAHVWMHHWLDAYREQGRLDLDLEAMKQRLHDIATDLLKSRNFQEISASKEDSATLSPNYDLTAVRLPGVGPYGERS